MRLVMILLVVGCAHEETRLAAPACTIAEVTFAASDTDYSKPLTAQTLDKLSAAVRSDRELFRADPSGKALGLGLTDLNMSLDKGPFVAKGALQSATRLRQLDCAIRRGTFNGRTQDADQLYGDILGDVDKELKLARAQ
jgi:hypothetical protein